MNEDEKKELLDLLQQISYGFEKFMESDSDDDFWEPWSAMHKYISDKGVNNNSTT